MKNNKQLSPIRICALGATNGLLIGSAFEFARIALLNFQMSRHAREDAKIGLLSDYIAVHWQPLIPLLFIAVFAVVACVVYRYFAGRTTLLLSLWFGLGAVAIGSGYFMSTSKPDVFSFLCLFSLVAICYLVYRLWKNRPDSIFLLWLANGISAVVVIACVVQLMGLFVYFVYWKELRSLSLWSLFLFGVVSINAIYGSAVHLISNLRSNKLTLT